MSKLKIKSDDYINQLRFHDGTWYMLGMENLGGGGGGCAVLRASIW